MNIFKELERIKQLGFIGGFGFFPSEENDGTAPYIAGFSKNAEGIRDVELTQTKDETLEQFMYRAILEFDEKYPELA